MTELTKEYFDKALGKLVAHEFLDKLLKEQTIVNFNLVKEYIDERLEVTDGKIESLAASTAEEFNEMRERLTSVDMQFLRLSSRIDDVENRLTGFQQGTTTKLSIIESKLEAVQIQVKQIAKQSLEDTNVLVRDITKLQKRVAVLEKQIQKLKTK